MKLIELIIPKFSIPKKGNPISAHMFFFYSQGLNNRKKEEYDTIEKQKERGRREKELNRK